jgi:anthranilate phosphoribosyltransferase
MDKEHSNPARTSFHPAMKNVGPERARRKNFFQHVRPYGQSVVSAKPVSWCFQSELARMYAYLYQDTATNYTILHSLDGYDEVSLTCPTIILQNGRNAQCSNFGLQPLNQSDIKANNN